MQHLQAHRDVRALCAASPAWSRFCCPHLTSDHCLLAAAPCWKHAAGGQWGQPCAAGATASLCAAVGNRGRKPLRGLGLARVGREKSRDCSARNSTNPDRDQLATVLKSCTTLSSDRPAQEDTAVPRLAPSSGSHQSSASTAASRGPKTRRRSQPARAPCPEPSAAATSAALWPSFSFLGPHHPPYARAPRGDQQQSLQGSASFTPMLVQTERHPAGLAAPRAGHGSRQKRHEDTAKLGACHKSELSARMLGCRLLVTAPSHPTRIRYPSGHLQRAKRRLDRLACLDHRDGPPGAAAVVAQHQLQVARGGCACCSGPAVEVGSASRRAVEAAASAGQPLEQRGHPRGERRAR